MNVPLVPWSNAAADAGDELGGAEGLGQVVVGAEAQRAHGIVLACARGQDDHRHAFPFFLRAQPLEQLKTIGVRQHHVEQHEVHRVAAVDALDRLAPVGDRLDGKALLLGQVAEQVRHVHVVLDDEEPLWSIRIQGLDPKLVLAIVRRRFPGLCEPRPGRQAI